MTGSLKPEIELREPELTPGVAGYREAVPMELGKRIPILSVDIQVWFRGAIYEFNLTRALKWLGVCAIVGLRLYRAVHGSAS